MTEHTPTPAQTHDVPAHEPADVLVSTSVRNTRKPARLTERQIKKVRELRKAGFSQEAIAAVLRMTRNTLMYRLKASGHEFTPVKPGQVRRTKAHEIAN